MVSPGVKRWSHLVSIDRHQVSRDGLTWCEVLCFVNHQDVVHIELWSSQLPQFHVAVVRQSNVCIVHVRHLRPHLLRIIGEILPTITSA